MKNFTADEVLKIAKRHNNNKRAYLLVNPLQGKHLAVSPTAALEMMKTLGDKVAKKYFSAKLVIGFAETATAIGAMVAASLENCIYIQTTRENLNGNFIEFLEEHSHAPQQKLYAENLRDLINATETIIFVDDELSTGKTLRNMIRQLKNIYPNLNGKKLVAASIINRLTAENEKLLEADGISCEFLVKLREENFDVEEFETAAPKILNSEKISLEKISFHSVNFKFNPRFGVNIHEYIKTLEKLGGEFANLIQDKKSILVLGTEESMLPAIITGKILENGGAKVFTHSTTRSPIGVCSQKNYPITEGYQLKSFYDAERTTFIYNLKHYDAVFVVSDTANFQIDAVKNLVAALNIHGCEKIIFVGGENV